MAVRVRSYLSPTLVLLAFDWTEGATREDFLGFAIKRTPGFTSPDGRSHAHESWLPNRLTFEGPVPDTQADAPSRIAPIQKFMWWDARIEPTDRRKTFRYDVYPVVGQPAAATLLEHEAAAVTVTLPAHIENGIGTWFNRAVVSSQAFSRQLKTLGIAHNESPPPDAARALRTWLANDLEQTFAEIFSDAHEAAAAVYHLTDRLWALPAFESFGKAHGKDKLALVYDAHTVRQKGKPPAPSPNAPAVAALAEAANCYPRERTHIMHNKFIVASDGETRGTPVQLLTGSANFTTEGITEQANVLHTFASPELAARYADRARSLAGDPSIAETAQLAPGWSAPVEVGGASVRVSFSPEPKGSRTQIDTIVEAIGHASHSVLFCLFMPTDAALRDACFQAGDNGLMMFGLVNHISGKLADQAPGGDGTLDAAELANLALYHRSRDNRDVIDAGYFSPSTVPDGFEPELRLFPGETPPKYAPVIIHHKFIVIDAEGANPIVYTGSANMSNNSEHYNDENLLEIRDRRIAGIYLAEFLRLYEHYRARAIAIDQRKHRTRQRLSLQPDRRWADKYYKAGSPEEKARVALAMPAPSTT